MITDYRIFESNDRIELCERVKEHIELGWQPQGGVNVVMVPGGILGPDREYSQAMVKIGEF
jgi:hypothetical protein